MVYDVTDFRVFSSVLRCDLLRGMIFERDNGAVLSFSVYTPFQITETVDGCASGIF